MKSAGRAFGAYKKYKTYQKAKIVGEVVSDEIRLSTVSTAMKETAKQTFIQEVKETAVAFAATKTFTYLANETEKIINEENVSNEVIHLDENEEGSNTRTRTEENLETSEPYIDEDGNTEIDLGNIYRYHSRD